jgi:hypothetical protein
LISSDLVQVHEDLATRNSSEVRTLRARITNPCRSFRMRTRNFLTIVLAITMVLAPISQATAAIEIDGFDSWHADSTTLTGTFDASGSDKLVVVVTGEHGHNNNAGACSSITYDGVLLTEAVNRNAITGGTDTLYNDIWYLDAPAAGVGEIIANVSSRGNVTVFALSGTAAGVGAIAISDSHERSVDLTTTGNGSLVISSFGLGGGGNTGSVAGVSADAPLIQTSAISNGNWDGHVTGYAIVPTIGTNTYSFTGGNTSGSVVIAAEFLNGTTPAISNVAAGNWNEPTTWDTLAVPTSSNDVTIFDAHVITLQPPATPAAAGAANLLNINDGGVLNVNNDLAVVKEITIAPTGVLNIGVNSTLTAGTASTAKIFLADATSKLDVANLTISTSVGIDNIATLDKNITVEDITGTLAMGGADYDGGAGSLDVQGTITGVANITVANLTLANATTIAGGNTITAQNGTLSDVTIGAGDGTISTGGAITASNLTILDNSTLAVQGSGTLSFNGTSTVSATGTAVNISGGSTLELCARQDHGGVQATRWDFQ